MEVGHVIGDWQTIGRLGAGGQGEVFIAWRHPAALKTLAQSLRTIVNPNSNQGNGPPTPLGPLGAAVIDFIKSLKDWNKSYLGAVKVLKGRDDPEQSLLRMRREVESLKSLSHPNILKLLDSNMGSVNDRFLVTEFHQNGSVDRYAEDYRGNVLKTLKAIRPVVDALSCMHKNKFIHRDIKPQNILVGDDGRLILGDFGLVYLKDMESERLSGSMESVGTTDWMAPWARGGILRPEQASGNLDNFGIGKIIYCLISGKSKLINWYHRKPGNNLESMYLNDPYMADVNALLDKCVVEDEDEAKLGDASHLLSEIDRLIQKVERGFGIPGRKARRACLVCGKGHYELQDPDPKTENTFSIAEPGQNCYTQFGMHLSDSKVKIMKCNYCDNIQFFKFPQGKTKEENLRDEWGQ